MAEDFRRHNISNRMWTLLQAHLPGRKGSSGRNARDTRQFINAVIWILRTGAPCAMTGFTPILWRLEEYSSAFLQMER